MKTIFIFAAGSFAPGILNQIITHPEIIDVALGCLLGILFGLLCACVFVGPTRKNTKKHEKTHRLKPTQRRIINSTAKQPAYVFVPQNYPQGAYA